MTNKEKYADLRADCMKPYSKRSYCKDLIKLVYLKDPKIRCAWYDAEGDVQVRSCEACKRHFMAWLKEEADE